MTLTVYRSGRLKERGSIHKPESVRVVAIQLDPQFSSEQLLGLSSEVPTNVQLVMSATNSHDEVSPDEETPLLSSERVLKRPPTAIPWAQVWIILVLQLAEPLTSQVIYPFTPEVCRFYPLLFFSPILDSSFVMLGLHMVMSPV